MSCNPLIEENKRERERERERERGRQTCRWIHREMLYVSYGLHEQAIIVVHNFCKNIMNANGPYKLYEKDLKDLTSFHKKNKYSLQTHKR